MPHRHPKSMLFPDSILSAHHDGEGWCIRAERLGEEPFHFGCYAATAKDAHWAACEVAKPIGATVAPLRLH